MQHQSPSKLHPIGPFVVGMVVGYMERESKPERELVSLQRWHLLAAWGGAEFKIAREIRSNGMATYVPCYRRKLRTRSSHHHREIKASLYPGYMFVGFDPGGELWHTIPGIDGVIKLFMIDGHPISISREVISRVREVQQAERYGLHDCRPPMPAKVGDVVRLVDHGAFTGLFGVIVDVDEVKRHIRIDMEIMRRAVPMWIPEEKFEIV